MFGTVTISEILGYLALMSLLSAWGQMSWTSWNSWKGFKGTWDLSNHSFDKMPSVVEYTLRFCLNRGFVVITDRNSDRYVLFRKYILRKGEYGLEFGFPDTEWSKVHVPTLRDALTAEGVSFREASKTYGKVKAFIHVNCGRDINKAVDLARRCFFDFFRLAADTRFKSSPSNYSTVHDDVDDPEYQNPSLFEHWPAFRAQQLEKGHEDPNLLMKMAVFTVGLFFICYPALWGTWYLAEGSPPDWQWSMGSIHLAGSHATWILLLTYYLLRFVSRKTRREFARESKSKPRTKFNRILGPLFKYTLPLAVIASWLGI